MKYIAVIHSWFMVSQGFEVHEIGADNQHDADKEASLLADNERDTFKHRAFVAIEIGTNEVIKPRKLNFKERVTGRLSS